MKGTVKWFDAKAGYGFILPDDKGEDVFVHKSRLKGLILKDNQRVQFDREEGKPKDGRTRYIATHVEHLKITQENK